MDTYLECPLPENDFLLSTCPDGHNRTLTLFASIGMRKKETHGDFHQVPPDLTLAEAAVLLNRQPVVADGH